MVYQEVEASGVFSSVIHTKNQLPKAESFVDVIVDLQLIFCRPRPDASIEIGLDTLHSVNIDLYSYRRDGSVFLDVMYSRGT